MVDTSNLTDREEEILKAINNLYEVCSKYNASAFLRVVRDKKRFFGLTKVASGTPEKLQDDLNVLLNSINTFVQEVSNNQVTLMKIKPDEEKESF